VSAPPLERLLRTSEVAEIFRVSPRTVTGWAKRGLLPYAFTLGGHRRFPEAPIRALATAMQQQSAGGDAAPVRR
jgi:excisionase family DNA binding protein